MVKKSLLTFSIILFLVITPLSKTSANSDIDLVIFEIGQRMPSFQNTLNSWQTLYVEKDVTYETTNDPNVRSGTQNWEEPQGNFFVVPGVVLGLLVLAMFFNRK